MNEQPMDPRAERLIALLYGELPQAEETALRREIEMDPALKAQWEELVGTRSLLGGWEISEPAPGFVFVGQGEAKSNPVRALRRGWREMLQKAAVRASWGFAVAAAAVLLLALGHFRVEKVNGGLAFRVGAEHAPLSPVGQPLEPLAARPLLTTPGAMESPLTLASQEAPSAAGSEKLYMTKDEFRAYSAGMAQTMMALLNDYSRQRDQDVVNLVRAAYTGMERKQTQDYDDLRTRIEAFGLGLARQQYNTDARLDLLTRQSQEGILQPANETAPTGGEGERK
jgi:hypothetical protein